MNPDSSVCSVIGLGSALKTHYSHNLEYNNGMVPSSSETQLLLFDGLVKCTRASTLTSATDWHIDSSPRDHYSRIQRLFEENSLAPSQTRTLYRLHSPQMVMLCCYSFMLSTPKVSIPMHAQKSRFCECVERHVTLLTISATSQ